MMKKILFLLLTLFPLLVIGCAKMDTVEPFAAQDLSPLLESGKFVQKADNFLVILDASTSMTQAPDSIYYYEREGTKFDQAKRVVDYLNQTIPALTLQGGLRVFGPGAFSLRYAEKPLYGMTPYSREGFGEALATVTGPGGGTPLAEAIAAAGRDLAGVSNQTALIIVSDAEDVGEGPVIAAQELKEKFKEELCIYPILIGKAVDWEPPGEKEKAAVMKRLAKAGQCGFNTDYETVKSPFGMVKFVTKVFFEKSGGAGRDKGVAAGVKGPASAAARGGERELGGGVDAVETERSQDHDGDGITDALDKCPATPFGLRVDDDGCPVPIQEEVSIKLQVEFDFDKDAIRPIYRETLKDFAGFLNAHPELSLLLEGHTDNFGAEKYNLTLSDDRAESVKNYLVEHFKVESGRIKTIGYGYSRPLSTNDTPAGRQRNRRVQAVISGQ